MLAANKYKFKVTVNNNKDNRLWRNASPNDFEGLCSFITTTWNNTNLNFVAQYEDDEGDRITIASAQDLQDAFDFAQEENKKSLQIYVEYRSNKDTMTYDAKNDEFPNIISKSELGIVDTQRRTFTTKGCAGSDSAYVMFEPWRTGNHELILKAVICTKNGTAIGITTKKILGSCVWLFDEEECNTSYQLYVGSTTKTNAIHHTVNGVSKSVHSLSDKHVFTANDTLGMKVSFDTATIRFYWNSVQVGKAYKFPKDTYEFYPAICYVCKDLCFKPDPLLYRLELCTVQKQSQLQDDFIDFRIRYNQQVELTKELQESSTQIITQLQNQVEALQNEIELLQNEPQSSDDCKECRKWQDKLSDLQVKYMQQKKKIQNVKLYKFWDYDDIVDWIISITNGKYKQYEKDLRINMKKEKLNGEQIVHIDKNDLHRFGVTGFGDKIELMQHVAALVQQNKHKGVNDENEGHTAYI